METRKTWRLPLITEVEILRDDVGQTHGWLHDISFCGMCLISLTDPLEIGKVYDIRFQFPEINEKFSAKGKIRWVVPHPSKRECYCNGMEFIEACGDMLEKVERYSVLVCELLNAAVVDA